MCLAIVKPVNKTIPESFLRNGFSNNDHGAGIAYSDGNQLVIDKGYFGIESFLEKYHQLEKFAMLIHFRLATHGPKNTDNCHPFSFANGRLAAIHNGILNIKSSDVLSDTGHFVYEVLDPLVKHIKITNFSFKYLVEEAIGSHNKIAVMDNKGKTVIFNESAGHWNDGVWYSNKGYQYDNSEMDFSFFSRRITKETSKFPSWPDNDLTEEEMEEIALEYQEYYENGGNSLDFTPKNQRATELKYKKLFEM